MPDHRTIHRKAVTEPATLHSGAVRTACTVVNVSPSGARIRLGRCHFLPNDCVLTAMMFVEPIPVRIVWRRGDQVGVQFRVKPIERGAPRPARGTSAFAGTWGGRP